MQNSGKILVLALVGIALLLGVTSWWYRYEAAHRASQFWGPVASRLIAQGEGFEAITQDAAGNETRTDLGSARGQAHLRHAFMSDSNFAWDKPVDAAAIEWRWTLRFYKGNADEGNTGDEQAKVLLSADLKTIGKRDPATKEVKAFPCEPMTDSLTAYFEAVGLLEK